MKRNISTVGGPISAIHCEGELEITWPFEEEEKTQIDIPLCPELLDLSGDWFVAFN